MKIRISGNSVRLRLSQSEVLHFVSQGLVSDECHFGNEKLTYQIAQYNGNEIVASLTGQTISVQVPENLAAIGILTHELVLMEGWRMVCLSL